MKRVVAICVILVGSLQIAVAAGVPEKVEELLPEDQPTSAAVAGRFAERPPTEAGYPVEILVKMRQKLAGETAPPREPDAPDNGH
ncbi:hypothetical protein [Pseudooceanicola sp.]|uniref:hypothetical protein n=1 Tax=Pseudooceanicola sp. TaxID=1914328 RepID=UPI004059F7EB